MSRFIKMLIAGLVVSCLFSNCKENKLMSSCCTGDNSLYIDSSSFLWLPNAFTPNSDGVNDLFIAYAQGVNDYLIKVSQGSTLVFESNDIQVGWDGLFQNNLASEGKYDVTVTWVDLYQDTHGLTGTVCLMRQCIPQGTDINDCTFSDAYLTGLASADAALPVCL